MCDKAGEQNSLCLQFQKAQWSLIYSFKHNKHVLPKSVMQASLNSVIRMLKECSHLCTGIRVDRDLSFFCSLVTEGIPSFSPLYSVKYSNPTETNLLKGTWRKDDLSSLSTWQTESQLRSFRTKAILSWIAPTKWPTSPLLSVPWKLSSVWVSPWTWLLSCFKSRGKIQCSGDIFGDFPWGADRGLDENVKISLWFMLWSPISLSWCSVEVISGEVTSQQAACCLLPSNCMFSVKLSGNTHSSEMQNIYCNVKHINYTLYWSLSFLIGKNKFFFLMQMFWCIHLEEWWRCTDRDQAVF